MQQDEFAEFEKEGLFAFMDEAFARNQKPATGKYYSPMWGFTRELKGYYGVPSPPAYVPLESVLKWMKSRRLFWRDFPQIKTENDGIVEFLSVWDKITSIPGHGVFDQALRKAHASPLRITSIRSRLVPDYVIFVSYAGWLQAAFGDNDILLPCHKLAPMFGCTHQTIARYRRWAEEDGFLVLVEEHAYRRKATRFRFRVDLFPELRSGTPL
jgi:hypothetical protein